MVTVPDGCALDIGEVVTVARYGNSTSQPTGHRFPLNLPLVSEFFSHDQLGLISGDSYFKELPQLTIPKIAIHRPNISRFVAQDDVEKLNLRKAMDALKNDDVIVHTVADQIALTQETVARETWGPWTDYLTIALSVLCGLILLQLLYVTVKLRTLSLLIAVLQQQATTVEATDPPRLVLTYAGGSEKSDIKSVVAPGDLHLILTNSLGAWVWLILGGLLCLTLLMLARLLWLYWKVQLQRTNMHTTLALLIGDNEKMAIIPLLRLPTLACDLALLGEAGPDRLLVQGNWLPSLHFEWQATIVNEFLETTTQIPTHIALSWWVAFVTQKIIARRYAVSAVFIVGNQIQKIPQTPSQVRPTPRPPARNRAGGRPGAIRRASLGDLRPTVTEDIELTQMV